MTNLQTIRLQGIGHAPAKPAGELIVGDILSWNYMPKAFEVVAIAPCGAKSITVIERNIKTGAEHSRRFLKTRLVAA